MAKRKRLDPARMDFIGGTAESKTVTGPPVAQVAGEAAAAAALSELSQMVQSARDEGRLIVMLDCDAIDAGYLTRDRILADAEDLAGLKESIRARGQQTAIEVTDMGGGRYGLISGWRRLTALRALQDETGQAEFGRVKALITAPESAGAAYLAMVEENEIRVGLSYYERARVVLKAVEAGAFATTKKAALALFANASRARRSKINSFIPVVDALDGALRFPTTIGERLGLALSARITADTGFGTLAASRLAAAAPADATAEQSLLKSLLDGRAATKRPAERQALQELAPGIYADTARPGQITLSGPAVDEALLAALSDWLNGRAG